MFVCSVCGHTTAKWGGKCLECESWNSLEETKTPAKTKASSRSLKRTHPQVRISNGADLVPLHETLRESSVDTRIFTHSVEFDRVLGGGLTQNSVVLLSGEPGIGKSTLLLHAASCIKKHGAVLYVCAEESPKQVALRAQRLGLFAQESGSKNAKAEDANSTILLTSEYGVECIEVLVRKHQPTCVIVDSIQTIRSEELGQLSGRIAHISACASLCCQWTREYNTTVFLVAHVTKDGSIAGPKFIEHMVDTVIVFESAQNNVRFLYAQKNRYGATDEIGIFKMTEKGLIDMGDAGSLFLQEREGSFPSGICIAATYEGSRPFLVEIQALTIVSHVSQSRVFSDRIDARQVFRIAAVLERHLKIPLSENAIYVNVAGGMRIQETGFELALLIALYSAYYQHAISEHMCAIGEVSLAGEIRPVEYFEQRVRQAVDYGFSVVIAPHHNVRNYSSGKSSEKLYGAKTIAEAVEIVSQFTSDRQSHT